MDGFSNRRKLLAMADIACIVHERGFEKIRQKLSDVPLDFLAQLPFIGPVTVWHLAKNLGLDVAKPDRHLVKIARDFGYSCVQKFCAEIANSTGDRLAVVDLILWRFSAEKMHTVQHPEFVGKIY